MVDLLTLVMMHVLLALTAWRLLLRPDLDVEPEDSGAGQPETPKSA